MYERILYPTDGSEGAAAALDETRQLAELCGATVHVLHSIDTRPPALGIGGDPKQADSSGMVGNPEGGPGGMGAARIDPEELHEGVEASARELTEAIAAEFEPVPTTVAIRDGTPHEAILEYTKGNNIDAIVMGTHGRTNLDRYLLGSVTEKVVRLADVPVVTVRASD